jgi:hypothetical protein
MFGDDLYSEKRGIISRSMSDIFTTLHKLQEETGYEYSISL